MREAHIPITIQTLVSSISNPQSNNVSLSKITAVLENSENIDKFVCHKDKYDTEWELSPIVRDNTQLPKDIKTIKESIRVLLIDILNTLDMPEDTNRLWNKCMKSLTDNQFRNTNINHVLTRCDDFILYDSDRFNKYWTLAEHVKMVPP